MQIITLNANGIRAAARKGFFDWLQQQNATVICLQETKAQLHQLEDKIFFPKGYHCYYHSAQKPGYSGVALYSLQQPDQVRYGLNWPDMDSEGRWLQADSAEIKDVHKQLRTHVKNYDIVTSVGPQIVKTYQTVDNGK